MGLKIGEIKNKRTTLVRVGDTVLPEIIFSGTLDTNLYNDITSISNWYKYESDIDTVRSEISSIISGTSWSSLTQDEKEIASKLFCVDKDKRDEVHNDETQKGNAKQLHKLKHELNNTGVSDTFYDKSVGEVDSFLSGSTGELFNYIELFEEITLDKYGMWHKQSVNAAPNTVIMVTIANTFKKDCIGGIRQCGSKLNRNRPLSSGSNWNLPVKVDSEQKIEVYGQHDHIKMYITSQLS